MEEKTKSEVALERTIKFLDTALIILIPLLMTTAIINLALGNYGDAALDFLIAAFGCFTLRDSKLVKKLYYRLVYGKK